MELIDFTRPQAASEKKPAATKGRKKPAKKIKIVLTKAKRKNATARARLMAGNGKVTVNGRSVETIQPREIRDLIMNAAELSSLTKDIMKNSDVEILVSGGGFSGQAQAARSVLAKAIVQASSSEVVKQTLMAYDRSLLVDDYRRVEPKKFKGPKARARFQKSYR